jgi:quercetin dioxygenase-like cupin family protein
MLKTLSKFFLCLALSSSLLVAYAQTTLPYGFDKIISNDIVWKEGENGIKNAVLYGDPNKTGIYIIRSIFPAGVMHAPHVHDKDRWITVIKGTWYAGTDSSWDHQTTIAMPEGSVMFHPANANHFDGALLEPVEVQVIGMGPVKTTYLYPNEARYGKSRKLN